MSLVSRAVLNVKMKANKLFPKFVIRFYFMYCIAVAGDERSAAQSRPTCLGAASGD
jgi:hypothetical protein